MPIDVGGTISVSLSRCSCHVTINLKKRGFTVRSDDAAGTISVFLARCSCHVTGCHGTQETRFTTRVPGDGPVINRLAELDPEWALAAMLIRETRLAGPAVYFLPRQRHPTQNEPSFLESIVML